MYFEKLKKVKVSFVGKLIAATILGMSAAFFAPDVCRNTSFKVFAEEKVLTREMALRFMKDPRYFSNGVLDLSSEFDITEICLYAFAGQKGENSEETRIFEQIEEVILPPNCEKIGEGAFSGREINSATRIICNSGSHLTKVTIPSNIITIDDEAFNNCYRLKEVNFVDTQATPSRLTHIGNRAFSNTSIENISIPNGCKQIGDECLKDCRKLISFYLNPGIFSVPVGLCERCVRLEKVSMGGKVTSIGDRAFSGCRNLGNFDIVTVTKVDGTEVREIKSYNVENFELPKDIILIGDFAFDHSPIEHFTIPKEIVSIGKKAFSHSQIRSIELPKNLKSIPEGLCDGCERLEKLSMSNKVISIEHRAFCNCNGLKKVDIVNKTGIESYNVKDFKLPNIKSIGDVVFKFSSIEHFTIPKEIVSFGKEVFAYSSIRSIEIPKELKYIPERTFFACLNTSRVKVPKHIHYIGKECFSTNRYLRELEILGKKIALGKNCFNGCRSLQIVALSNAKKATFEGPPSSYGSNNAIVLIPADAEINK